jgi:hypothetical protein
MNKKYRKTMLNHVSGKLTVIEEIPENVTYRSNPKVKCLCQCGNEHLVKLDNLRGSDSIKSCGCTKREQMKRFSREKSNNFIDKAGLILGIWTVIEIDLNMPSGKGVYWKCRCKCGNTKTTRHPNTGSNFCPNCSPKPEKTKAEKKKTTAGYMQIFVGNHPRSDKNGYVLEHIAVMEKKIGRFVQKSESVHHINGQRGDNRIENLELWDKAHPAGQRNSEKMEFYMKELELKCDPIKLKEFCEKNLKL